MTNFRTAKYMPDGTAIDDPNKVTEFTETQQQAAQALVSYAGNPATIMPARSRSDLPASQSMTVRSILPVLPTDDTALWITDKTAALTVSIDQAVTFGGKPSIRIDIPANTSGTVKVGTSGANCLVPDAWDVSGSIIAIRCSDAALQSGMGVVNWYLGDATLANAWAFGFNPATTTPEYLRNASNDWIVFTPGAPTSSEASKWGNAGGAPAVATFMRSKLQWTSVSVPYATSVWIGVAGAYPATKPTVMLTFDDGYSSFYKFVAPILRYYNLPASCGIIGSLVGTAGYMTAAQIQELDADQSGLFEFVNHSVTHAAYNTVGAAAMYAEYVACTAQLRSYGITSESPLHIPYPNGQVGADLITLLQAGGYLSGRGAVSTAAYSHRAQVYGLGSKMRFNLQNIGVTGSGMSVAALETLVTNLITEKGISMIECHDFAATDVDAYTWSYDKFSQFIKWLAGQRDAGSIVVPMWSRWFRDQYGSNVYGS